VDDEKMYKSSVSLSSGGSSFYGAFLGMGAYTPYGQVFKAWCKRGAPLASS